MLFAGLLFVQVKPNQLEKLEAVKAVLYFKGDTELYLEGAWLQKRDRYTEQCTELHLLTSSCLM